MKRDIFLKRPRCGLLKQFSFQLTRTYKKKNDTSTFSICWLVNIGIQQESSVKMKVNRWNRTLKIIQGRKEKHHQYSTNSRRFIEQLIIIYGKKICRLLMKNKKEEYKKLRTGIAPFLHRWHIMLWHRQRCLTCSVFMRMKYCKSMMKYFLALSRKISNSIYSG